MTARSSQPFGTTSEGKTKCRYCDEAAKLWVRESDDSKSPVCAFHYTQQETKRISDVFKEE